MLKRDLGSDVRLNSELLCGQMEARGAIHAVAVQQRHGRHAQLGADVHQLLWDGGPLEEAEGRAGMELDEHSSQYSVVDSLDCPGLGCCIVGQATKHDAGVALHSDVPFIADPAARQW